MTIKDPSRLQEDHRDLRQETIKTSEEDEIGVLTDPTPEIKTEETTILRTTTSRDRDKGPIVHTTRALEDPEPLQETWINLEDKVQVVHMIKDRVARRSNSEIVLPRHEKYKIVGPETGPPTAGKVVKDPLADLLNLMIHLETEDLTANIISRIQSRLG